VTFISQIHNVLRRPGSAWVAGFKEIGLIMSINKFEPVSQTPFFARKKQCILFKRVNVKKIWNYKIQSRGHYC
jgi:hypothetical protein